MALKLLYIFNYYIYNFLKCNFDGPEYDLKNKMIILQCSHYIGYVYLTNLMLLFFQIFLIKSPRAKILIISITFEKHAVEGSHFLKVPRTKS